MAQPGAGVAAPGGRSGGPASEAVISAPRAIPALVTPFGHRGDLDLNAHRHNLSLLWSRGVRGFLRGGSNGEGPYLEPGGRHALATAAREALPEAFLLAGVAAESIRAALSRPQKRPPEGPTPCSPFAPPRRPGTMPPPPGATSPPRPPKRRCPCCSTR
jgi:hypothetical protein